MTKAARALWVAVVLLLVSGVLAAAVQDEERTVSTTAPATVPSSVDEVVAELRAFVAQERGLAFKQPVQTTLLDDAAFRARLHDREREESDREEIRRTAKVLRALGLLTDDVDLEAAIDMLAGDAVLGFYDYEEDELVVRGAEITPGVRSTLVHELTHALQDQHFELDRPDLEERDDEADTAFVGLVEGDAVRVEEAYRATLSGREREQAEAENEGGASEVADLPPVLLKSVAFPYLAGPPFVDALRRAGGRARVDEAFRHPPVTSEHLLHPERFLRGEAVPSVDEPPAEGEVFDRGVVGEFGLLLILENTPRGQALVRAAAGWGGDRYVAWEADGEVCVRATVRMDTPADTLELRWSLDRWAAERDDVTVDGAGPVTFTSCA